MKAWTKFLLAASVMALLLAAGACAKAEFEAANLLVDPPEVVEGQSATVSLDVLNVGNGPGDYAVVLKIDGVETGEQLVTLAPGERKTVTFSVPGRSAGVVSVDVNGLGGSLKVLRPAAFELANLAVVPAEINVGEEVTATIDVSNTGEVGGRYGLILKTGVESLSREVSLGAGASQTVTFTLSGKQPGTCQVDLNGVIGGFKVLKPAEIRVADLIISPAEPGPGVPADVSVTVSNEGESAGGYSLTFAVDGRPSGSKIVTVEGGQSVTVSFTVSRKETGNYHIALGGLEGILKVKGDTMPVLRNGDRWVYNHTLQGVNYKRTETVVGQGAVLGEECYRIKVEWSPPFAGLVPETEYMIERKSRENLWTSFTFVSSGQNMAAGVTSDITRTGQSPWRLFVGNQWTEMETEVQKMGPATSDPSPTTRKMGTVFKVEALETVTVPAGTFPAFRIGFYSIEGALHEENWYSPRVKNWVKLRNPGTGESYELASYYISN